MGSHLTKYTNKSVNVKARVTAIFIKESKSDAKKRKRKSAKNKPSIKRRIFILEDIRKLDGKLLLEHSFIYDECIEEFKNVKVGDTIYFKDINFYAYGRPIFEHDHEFNLVYSHCIEFTSININRVSSGDLVSYIIPLEVGSYIYTTKYVEDQAKSFRGYNTNILVCRSLKDCFEYEPFNSIDSQAEFICKLKALVPVEEELF